jgi:iron complex outermembrane receptor protein
MGGKGIQFADTAIQETGIYGFVQQTLAENLILNGGIRFQNNSVYGNQWIPSLGFAYNFDHKFTWKGNISKGFRSPTMRELFMWGPNPNLNPETIISYETGVSRSFFNQRMSAELTVFALNGENLIVIVGPPNGYLNSGEISNKGIEFQMNAEATQNLRFNATYAYIHMENPVFATPEHHLFLNAHYRLKKLILNANVQHVSDLDNDVSPGVNLISYSVLNAKATYLLSKNIKLFVSGENLLNQEYEVNRFYTMPGATIFSGINFQF